MIIVSSMIITSFCSCGGNSKSLSVFSAKGDLIAELDTNYNLYDENMVYCDIAVSEATEILAELLDCSIKKAKKLLWKKEYKIYTYFDDSVQKALSGACEKYFGELSCGSAVTDLNGNLVAASGNYIDKTDSNAALNETPPYSTLKPLSVYAQAVEKGIINWSTVFKDSAYKQIKTTEGVERGWPANANGKYSESDITVYEALQKSLNTVAVKCLEKIGVNNSIEFLQKNFSIPLSSEQYTSTIHGEEEVIGNVAMGYLKEGVTPVDMAGYYQIFANGGKYEKPKVVHKICNKDGKSIYEREYSPKEVISPYTADIMNAMLQGVIKSGGTAIEAYVNGVQIAGKTGTNDNNVDCWFVGITPEYSCAVWHSQNYKNMAPAIFSETFKTVYLNNPDLKKNFKFNTSLKNIVYCEESGMKVSAGCKSIQVGYYDADTQLELCDKH